ncbi:phasin family protein [Sphingomonas sp. ID0503]|uniref:phasin family protein n=1 Tax=Sphingomonas sp. ID0503 TaxID=3399691 RepID=UPI003AFB0142
MASDPTGAFQRAGDAIKKASSEATENSHQISLKLLEQAENNTRAVFATMREMAKVSNPAEAMKLQAEFVKEQGQRAMEHAKEIGDLLTGFGRKAMSGLTDKDNQA